MLSLFQLKQVAWPNSKSILDLKSWIPHMPCDKKSVCKFIININLRALMMLTWLINIIYSLCYFINSDEIFK